MKNISALQKAEGTSGTGGTMLIVKDNMGSPDDGATGNRGNLVDFVDYYVSSSQDEQANLEGTVLIVKDKQGSPDTEGTEGTTGNYDDQEADEPEIDHTVPMEARPMYVTYDQPAPPYKRSGLWYHGISQKGDNPPEPVDTWICSPIYTEAQTHGTDGSNHGLLLRFKASSGSWKKWAAPMHLLKGAGDELRGELLDRGLRIDPKARMKLTDWLMAAYPKDHLTATAAVGWHGASFVMPDRIIGKDALTFQNESAVDPFDQAGTISGWRNEVGKRLAGNPLLVLTASAALAGPLLHPTGRQGAGLHLVGDSSSGKSTALAVAASIWGPPSFIRTWRATSNGLEGAAAEVNDSALILDEIGQADPREIGAIVYAIGNGTGKARANRSGLARKVARWRVMLLSSGERTLGACMAEDRGRAPKAGQLVRLLDIPVSRTYGAFDELHGHSGGAGLADALKQATQRQYGRIGIAFVEQLVETVSSLDLPGKLAEILTTPAFHSDDGLHQRAAASLALCGMAGELARDWGLLPIKEGEAMEAAALAFRLWAGQQGSTHTEDAQILQAVGDFIDRHGGSRFSPQHERGDPIPVRDRAGWRNDDMGTFLFTSAGLKEAVGGHDLIRALDALMAAGWITEHDAGKRSKKTKVESRPINLYWIKPKEVTA